MNIKMLIVHESNPQADKGDQEKERCHLSIETMADVQSGLIIDHQTVQKMG